MATKVVAKFYCESVESDFYFSTDESLTVVTMRPDFPKDDNPDHPNREFWHATPSGNLQMHLTNRAAADAFKAGAVYTVTFEKD